jgi:DNA-binding CsgD family transcriptional regulator
VGQLAEARRIAEAVGKVDQVARAFATLAGLLETFGRLEAAAEVALEGAEVAAGQGLGRWHGPFLTATAARALFGLGRWDEAEALLDRAAGRVAPELAATRVYIHSARGQLELARGRSETAAEQLAVAREAYAQTLTQPWFATPLFVATAELALLEGRLADAEAAVAEGLRIAGADPSSGAWLYALGVRAAADRAEQARARRDDEEALEARQAGDALAAEFHARLSPEGTDGTAPTPPTEALAALCEAELARLDGHADPQVWEAAAKAWEGLGEPYPIAYARWRQAEALLLAGFGREQVEPLLRAAHQTAVELGAAPLRAELEALARRGRLDLETDTAATPAEPPSPLDPLGLTAREQEVLALVALGRTNGQIAETLFISPKTATVHVSHILAKLGVRNRVEAATVAHRLGIVQPEP